MGSNAHFNAEEDLVNKTEPKEIKFPARALNIVWGLDNRYWRLPNINDIKGKDENTWQPAELVQVCWLEVTGSTPIKKDKRYKVTFELALKSDAFGWNGCQVYIMAKIGKSGKYKWTKMSLNQEPSNNPRQKYTLEDNNLVAPPGLNDTERILYFGLYEIWSGKWKGGLQVYNAIVSEVV